MKAMILAGGYGSRISEESIIKPKPMVEIGGMPILWHIMKIYSAHGINDFIICCGYKGYMIKEWFATYKNRQTDFTIDLRSGNETIHNNGLEPWKVTLTDTGDGTMTGGRIKRAAEFLGDDETFLLTYGDGVGDIDVASSINFHNQHGRLATMTAVQPDGRFGAISLTEQQTLIRDFKEKPKGDGTWINAGYFVLDRKVIDLIDDDKTVWELAPLEKLSEMEQIEAFKHKGFWMPMDTLRDKNVLEEYWDSGDPPWKLW